MGKMGTKSDGVVLGHEFSGTVVEVGKDSTFQVLYTIFLHYSVSFCFSWNCKCLTLSWASCFDLGEGRNNFIFSSPFLTTKQEVVEVTIKGVGRKISGGEGGHRKKTRPKNSNINPSSALSVSCMKILEGHALLTPLPTPMVTIKFCMMWVGCRTKFLALS